jgi:hypothetical protein
VDLTPAQQRTLDGLIGRQAPPPLPADTAMRLRDRLEAAVAGLELAEPLWIWKRLLTDHAKCEGMFAAVLAGEGEPFAHSLQTAAGALFHRSIQLDTQSERGADVRSVVERAAARQAEDDGSFGGYWQELDVLGRGELLSEAAQGLALFRERFPPFDRRWQPVPEQRLRVLLGGGAVTLTGRVDLMLGRTQRLLIDFKTGDARPEHAEDMRFYALLLTLSFGVAPYRVATVFLESGEWQLEDVDGVVLDHAADRVIAAARTAAAATSGRTVPLNPGAWCRWCPRALTCPSSTAAPAPSFAGPTGG